MGEDRCRVRSGSSPQAPAAVRNAAVHCLESVEATGMAAAARRFAAHPLETLALLLT